MKNFSNKTKFKLLILTLVLIGLILGVIISLVIYFNVEAGKFIWYGWILIPICVMLIFTLSIYGILNLFGFFKWLYREKK
ncbi:hypothetical protein [Mycoplasmopsis glycophila]|uniref:Uncharacterized protein n=1 Tax=Mycoplasmopsis glycophila TaxID=171285 RepID=A0A449AUR1_9BACT|nr:hypothetical protein [Mycoplasmopsis glycophila]VEU70228.1 Uncharacterised protein [Mycoplasmopsis glycophila]